MPTIRDKKLPKIQHKLGVHIDLHDHTICYAHLTGGHFGYGHFSPGVPQILVELNLTSN